MAILTQVFDKAISMIIQLWNALSNWGIFGSFIMFSFVLRKLTQTFNKLKP